MIFFLNELLEKKDWEWTPECLEAFFKIKVLTSDLFLTHYNQDLGIIVASDASSYGIGSCILYKMPDGSNKPVAHASKTLPAEKNYSQIEKASSGRTSLLRKYFAVTKFHRYIHGRHFTL